MATFETQLIKATLVKRYKRFLADCTLENGETVTAHCPNTGSMKTCGSPGDTVYLQYTDNPKRKLNYTWELTETKGGFIGVNTVRPNAVVERAIAEGKVVELAGYDHVRREVKYGTNSRIDLYLTKRNDLQACYVEVKNTTLLDADRIIFPDAVSARGLKHLHELSLIKKQGQRAVMFYLINRPEGEMFAPASVIDPAYSAGLKEAIANGVEILAYRAVHSLNEIVLGDPVKIADTFD